MSFKTEFSSFEASPLMTSTCVTLDHSKLVINTYCSSYDLQVSHNQDDSIKVCQPFLGISSDYIIDDSTESETDQHCATCQGIKADLCSQTFSYPNSGLLVSWHLWKPIRSWIDLFQNNNAFLAAFAFLAALLTGTAIGMRIHHEISPWSQGESMVLGDTPDRQCIIYLLYFDPNKYYYQQTHLPFHH